MHPMRRKQLAPVKPTAIAIAKACHFVQAVTLHRVGDLSNRRFRREGRPLFVQEVQNADASLAMADRQREQIQRSAARIDMAHVVGPRRSPWSLEDAALRTGVDRLGRDITFEIVPELAAPFLMQAATAASSS